MTGGKATFGSANSKLALLALLTLALLLPGCVRSLYPLHDDRTRFVDPALVGVWKETPGDKETWEFIKADDTSYRLVVTAEGVPMRFEAHLLKLGSTVFLDLRPQDLPDSVGKFYGWHYVPTHSFLLVERVTPVLRMAFMDESWLEEYVKTRPNAIRHDVMGDELLLTAPTKDLQAFVLAHVKTKGAFDDWSNLQRVK